jgi:hypothetical protein
MTRTSYIQWDDNDVCSVLDQQVSDFYSANWLKQQSTGRYVAPLVDMLLHSDTLSWYRSNHCLLLLLNAVCLVEKQKIPIL